MQRMLKRISLVCEQVNLAELSDLLLRDDTVVRRMKFVGLQDTNRNLLLNAISQKDGIVKKKIPVFSDGFLDTGMRTDIGETDIIEIRGKIEETLLRDHLMLGKKLILGTEAKLKP